MIVAAKPARNHVSNLLWSAILHIPPFILNLPYNCDLIGHLSVIGSHRAVTNQFLQDKLAGQLELVTNGLPVIYGSDIQLLVEAHAARLGD